MPFPQSLTTTPFDRSSTGWFEANSCKPTSGGLLPSSVQQHKLSLAFVTHARQPARAIDWNFDEDRSRMALGQPLRTGFGPENITRLRRFAVGILKSFQQPGQSIAAMMRKLCFRSRIVFDYLRMTKNSADEPAGA